MANNFQLEINNLLCSNGLPLECGREVTTDGDCFYDSVLALLEDPEMRQTIASQARNIHTIEHLRQALVEFIRTNIEKLKSLETFKAYWEIVQKDPVNKELSWEEYLNAVATTKKWADQLVVMCMAVFVGKDIMLASSSPSGLFLELWDRKSGQPEGWPDAITTPPLILGQLNEKHFEPLKDIPPTSGKQVCKGCGTKCKSLRGHIVRTSKPCKLFYNTHTLTDQAALARKVKCRENARMFRQRRREEKSESEAENMSLGLLEAEYYQDCVEERKKAKYYQDCGKERRKAKYYQDSWEKKRKAAKERYYNIPKEIRKEERRARYQKHGEKERAARKLRYEKNGCKEREAKAAKIAIKKAEERYMEFKEDLMACWSVACVCCHRIMATTGGRFYPGGIRKLESDVETLAPGLFSKSIKTPVPKELKFKGEIFLCSTCQRWLLQWKEVPPLSYVSGLDVDDIPPELKLNDLEAALLARRILFLKMFKMPPKSRWQKVKDKTVCVPVCDNILLETLYKLNTPHQRDPHKAEDSGFVCVKLKRKLEYKNAHITAYIHPKMLNTAVMKLKELGLPRYCNINIPEALDESDSEKEQGGKDQFDEEQQNYIRRNQFNLRVSTMMTEIYPETSVVQEQKSGHQGQEETSVNITVGEGKVPTNLVRDEAFDVDAFPHFHPSEWRMVSQEFINILRKQFHHSTSKTSRSALLKGTEGRPLNMQEDEVSLLMKEEKEDYDDTGESAVETVYAQPGLEVKEEEDYCEDSKPYLSQSLINSDSNIEPLSCLEVNWSE